MRPVAARTTQTADISAFGRAWIGKLSIAGVVLAVAASGCRREEQKARPAAHVESPLGPLVVRQYADMAHAAYADAAEGARHLLSAVNDLIAGPSPQSLERARQAWLSARRPYLQTEVYRFYDGPIDRVEMLVNTWPIDENYVEAGEGATKAGIIDDATTYPELTPAVLSALNAKEGETSISTGYHVIEFLLWGRDTHADGPGDRPYTDYVVPKKAAASVLRRATYLRVATELLVRHLDEVVADWAADRADNYRASFLRMRPREALGLIVKGMGSLSGPELAGERLTVAYETKDQENEHSCFSDNTHNDIVLDAVGIQNVCLGHYTRTDGTVLQGPGVCDWLAVVDGPLGERLRNDLAASVAAARSIPAPFDQAILGKDSAPGRTAILATIKALELQTQTLAAVAATFDIALALAPSKHR